MAFKPSPTTLSPTDVDELVEARRAGTTISRLAAEFGVHRTTVAAHLERHGVPRHSEQAARSSLSKCSSKNSSHSSNFGVGNQLVKSVPSHLLLEIGLRSRLGRNGHDRQAVRAGKVFTEWVSVPQRDRSRWQALLREGVAFVAPS